MCVNRLPSKSWPSNHYRAGTCLRNHPNWTLLSRDLLAQSSKDMSSVLRCVPKSHEEDFLTLLLLLHGNTPQACPSGADVGFLRGQGGKVGFNHRLERAKRSGVTGRERNLGPGFWKRIKARAVSCLAQRKDGLSMAEGDPRRNSTTNDPFSTTWQHQRPLPYQLCLNPRA